MATDSRPKIKLRASMLSDVGVVRDHNEDAAYIDPDHRFFIVADGMGGHAAGEVASAMAVDAVREALEQADHQIAEFAHHPSDSGRKGLAAILEQAVRGAHNAVYERGLREPDKQGMGTTLDVLLIAGPEAFVAHVGDSRTYLLRAGKTAQVTTDHTVAEVLLIEGKLSPEEAQVSPLRTILVNAIGVADDVGVEMAHVRLRTGDQLLLSSDGLHDYFPAEEEIAEQLAGKPEEILARMIETARNRGGHDNITGLVVQVLDAAEEVDMMRPGDEDAIPEPVARGDTLPFGEAIKPPASEESAEPKTDGETDDEADTAQASAGDEAETEGASADTEAHDQGSSAESAEAPDADTARSETPNGDDTSDAADPQELSDEGTQPLFAPQAQSGDGATDDERKPAGKNGRASKRPPSPPIVAETQPKHEDDDEGYVEDDTLVGYDADVVKPPAPKPESPDGGADSADGEASKGE
jgi:serine/threonine protein phosphatase PrpC